MNLCMVVFMNFWYWFFFIFRYCCGYCNCCELYDVWWMGGSGFWWCICIIGSDGLIIGGGGGCCCGGSCWGGGCVVCWSFFVKLFIFKFFMCNRCLSFLIFMFRIWDIKMVKESVRMS